ncbi:MAG: ComEC/Rec2 family competence protein [Candidatus Nomurabacteria bacterium]
MSTHLKTLILVGGICLGISIGEISKIASEVAIFAVILFLIQVGIYFGERKRKQMSDAVGVTHLFSFPLITILFSLGLFLGILRVQLVEEKVNYICEVSCTFDAKIISSGEIKNDYQVFNVHPIDATSPTSLISYGVASEVLDIQIKTPLYPKYKIGETLKLSGKVLAPEILPSHGEKKSFDYSSYLMAKNIGSEMFYPKIELINSETNSLAGVLGRLKENMVGKIDLYVSSPASSLASGMLFGNSSISKELNQTFRVAGLSHIIVLSGFNIAIVISFILFVFAFLPLLIRVSLASLSVILFVIMVGGEASVVRATLMAFIALLATVIGREYVAKQALIISLFLIIIYEPYALLHDVSLHLSFLATAGIVYLSAPLESICKKYFVRLSSQTFLSTFSTTLSAYIITLPYLMYTFGSVSIYALISNILVLPFVPIAMLVSFLVVSNSYVSHFLALFFGYIDSLIINFMIWIAKAIELLPFSYLSFQISLLEMFTIYFFIVIIIGFILKKISTISFLSVKQNDLKIKNETERLKSEGVLTDIISY